MFDAFELRDFVDVNNFVNAFEASHVEEPLALGDSEPDEQAIEDAALAGA